MITLTLDFDDWNKLDIFNFKNNKYCYIIENQNILKIEKNIGYLRAIV